MVKQEFEWDKQKVQAAYLLGTSTMTQKDIGDYIGISPSTISTWKKIPEFKERVDELEQEELEEVMRLPFARKSGRIRKYDELLQGMSKVIEARKEDFRGTPEALTTGGDTGLVVRKKRALGSGGPFMEIIEEYEVDTGLIKAIESMSTQIAKETGQWQEKSEITGSGGGAISIQFGEMNSEDAGLDEDGEI